MRLNFRDAGAASDYVASGKSIAGASGLCRRALQAPNAPSRYAFASSMVVEWICGGAANSLS